MRYLQLRKLCLHRVKTISIVFISEFNNTFKPLNEQESIPVGCVLPALSRTGGGLPDRDTSWTDTPREQNHKQV